MPDVRMSQGCTGKDMSAVRDSQGPDTQPFNISEPMPPERTGDYDSPLSLALPKGPLPSC